MTLSGRRWRQSVCRYDLLSVGPHFCSCSYLYTVKQSGYQTWRLRVCPSEVTHCPNPPTGVGPTLNSHMWTIITWHFIRIKNLTSWAGQVTGRPEACGGGRGGRMKSDRRLCNLLQRPSDVLT